MFSACGNKPNPAKEEAYQKAAQSFVADESFFPILDEELFYFNSQRLDTIAVDYMNEQDAVKRLMKLDTWLAFTTRRFTAKEEQSLRDRQYLPRAIPIAYDGLAIIVNNANPDSCITVTDFARILRGEATKWGDIYSQSRLGTIDVVFDNPLSSTVRWCVDSILGGKEFTNPNIGAVQTSAAVIDYVESHQNALGIIGSNWLNDKGDSTNLTFINKIRVMKVTVNDVATSSNSWKPYQVYLLDGRYPFARTLYAICVDPQRKLPWSFANYTTSPTGQLIVKRAGLLPYRGDITIKKVKIKRD